MIDDLPDRDRAEPAVKEDGIVRIFLVDDHPLVRHGLISVLARERDMQIVGHAETAENALRQLETTEVDVIVLDYRLPDMTGVELCREIAERRIAARTIILSAFIQDDLVYAALLAGASAYVVKDVDADELKRAIRVAADGQAMIDPQVAGRIVSWAARFDQPGSSTLSPIQQQLVRLLCQGRSNEETAAAVGLSLSATKKHLRRLFDQLGARTRVEAIAAATRKGLG